MANIWAIVIFTRLSELIRQPARPMINQLGGSKPHTLGINPTTLWIRIPRSPDPAMTLCCNILEQDMIVYHEKRLKPIGRKVVPLMKLFMRAFGRGVQTLGHVL